VAAKRAKIEILLSPKAALQLKCIFAVYGLNLINNFCIVANSLSFLDFLALLIVSRRQAEYFVTK